MISDVASVRASNIVLASSSPRRVEILNEILGLKATVVPSTFPEDLDKSKFTSVEYVKETARQKALEVYARLASEGRPPSLVVGADTVVVLGEEILEKPKSTGVLSLCLPHPRPCLLTRLAAISPCATTPVSTTDSPALHCSQPTTGPVQPCPLDAAHLARLSPAISPAVALLASRRSHHALEAQRRLTRGVHWSCFDLRHTGKCWGRWVSVSGSTNPTPSHPIPPQPHLSCPSRPE